MTVDVSKIKVGDKVTLVPLEVVEVCAGRVRLNHKNGWLHWVSFDHIAAHHREFQVGDRVKHATIGAHGTIEHIARDKAWVMWDNAGDGMALLSNLSFVKSPE